MSQVDRQDSQLRRCVGVRISGLIVSDNHRQNAFRWADPVRVNGVRLPFGNSRMAYIIYREPSQFLYLNLGFLNKIWVAQSLRHHQNANPYALESLAPVKRLIAVPVFRRWWCFGGANETRISLRVFVWRNSRIPNRELRFAVLDQISNVRTLIVASRMKRAFLVSSL